MSRQIQGRRCYFDYIRHSPWYSPFIDAGVANYYHWNYTFRDGMLSVFHYSHIKQSAPLSIFTMECCNKTEK